MEVQFHNENVHIMLHRISHFFIAIVDDNLLNEKRRVNKMVRHITCTLSHCQWVGSQWQGNMSHTHKQQAAPIWSSSNQCVMLERIFFLSVQSTNRQVLNGGGGGGGGRVNKIAKWSLLFPCRAEGLGRRFV